MRRTCFTIFGIVLLAHPLLGQCRAEVAGTVVDESGAPIEGALVSLKGQAPTGGSVHLRYFKTNEDGAFDASLDLKVPGRAPGNYWVYAKKEEAGYPDNLAAFYVGVDSKPPQITLDCGLHIADVVVEIGPKSAYISRINVIDAATGALVENPRITLRRVHAPFPGPSPDIFSLSTNAYLRELNPGYRGIPIPSNTQISYQISAPGYTTSEPRTIQVAPSKSVEISVKLQKSVNP